MIPNSLWLSIASLLPMGSVSQVKAVSEIQTCYDSSLERYQMWFDLILNDENKIRIEDERASFVLLDDSDKYEQLEEIRYDFECFRAAVAKEIWGSLANGGKAIY